MSMIVAQALGEYGMMAAAAQGLTHARIQIEDTLRTFTPTQYGIALLVAVVLWKIMGRR